MIKLIKSTFYNEVKTKKRLCEFINSTNQLSMGLKCLEFEAQFSKYQKRRYSVFFNSGSSANLALIQSLLNLSLLSQKDNVGFSAITWATNVMPLLQLQLKPIPLDVSLANLNTCSSDLLTILKTTELKAFFITNLLGFCGDLDKIKKICKEEGIILIEDNCESLGSELNNFKLGNFGLASTFSFFVGHHMSTIEGGMVCTDDKDLYDMLLMVRSHGWDRNLDTNKKNNLRMENNINNFYSKYTFYYQAYNLRPTELQAFLGLEQLNYIDEINIIRNKNFKEFNEISNSNSNFLRLSLEHMNFISNFAFPLICKDMPTFNEYSKKFEKNNIEIRPIVGGHIIEQPFFKAYLKQNNIKFHNPKAKKIHELGFYIPNNPELTKTEKDLISSLIN